MVMKNVNSAQLNRAFSQKVIYFQKDHYVEIKKENGIIIMPILDAFKKYKFIKEFFRRKPEEGYFIWVKKQIDFPLETCISICSPKVSQILTNLFIIEKGLKIKANTACMTEKNNLTGTHIAYGKIVLKENSSLEHSHIHKWGNNDEVSSDYEFILEKSSRLSYSYSNLFSPKILNLKTKVISRNRSSSDLKINIKGINSKINLDDSIVLKEKNAQAMLRLRVVGRENTHIKGISTLIAEAPGKGHLDCQGLLIGKKSEISLSPELICKDKNAQITHEASVGKISEQELTYLRTRGLNEKEAINLIVLGFLNL